MGDAMEAWTELVPGLWRHAYFTGTGIQANSLALRLADGSIAVLSPPAKADDALFAATDALGKVTVLLAPSTGHDLGQLPWQARYPEARCFAPEVAGPQIEKAKPGSRPLRPLAELAPSLPPSVRVVDVPETKSGLTMLAVDAGSERVLFIDEIINHMAPMPLMFRVVFTLLGSRGGVARTRVWTWAFTKDKGAVARTVLAEMDAHPPTLVLVSHGEPIRAVDEVRAQLTPIA
jgi:hypothetical protein